MNANENPGLSFTPEEKEILALLCIGRIGKLKTIQSAFESIPTGGRDIDGIHRRASDEIRLLGRLVGMLS
jgi:hypothetical protein